MQKLLINLIKLYQKTLSPDHGWFRARWPNGYCRFHPTCSQYAVEAIQIHGSIKGVFLGTKRILRCNPFSEPGVDPVPKL
jgi:putative membrane protein insertion efficiency factor